MESEISHVFSPVLVKNRRLSARVNCSNEHAEEGVLRRSITTALPFGSSFPGEITPPRRTPAYCPGN
jgi:hypothetical protein